MQNQSRSSWKLSITSSTVKFSVFISHGSNSNPNQFSYDIFLKDIEPGHSLKLSQDIIPSGSFTAAIKIQGYDTLNNRPIDNTLDVKVEAGDLYQEPESYQYSDVMFLE